MEPEPPAAPPGGRECVLVVEDEDALRRLTRAILSREGYTVLDAATPADALALAAAHPNAVDLVLTDVMMPGMRGWELVERLRDLQPRARVLFMSGYMDEVDVSSDRVRPLLSKPFKPRELLEQIRRVLDR